MTRLLRARLDLVAAFLLAAVVFAAAAGSSNEHGAVSAAKPARLVLLGLLGIVAVVRVRWFRSEWRFRTWAAAGLLAFCALVLDSATWSVLPHATVTRSASLAAVLVVGVLLAGAAARAPSTGRLLLDGLLVGVALVALAGLVLWLVDSAKAVQPASVDYPARFQGFGANPNTAAMLLAIGMPLALHRALATGGRAVRLAATGLLVMFAVEITASGSRGALLAGFGSLLVVVWFSALAFRGRVAASLAVCGSLAICAWAITLPSALTPVRTTHPATPAHAPYDAQRILPLEQETGSPWWTHHTTSLQRTLFSTSSRVRALRGAVHQGLGRPLLGTGFGAEEFVDRYYGFHSGNPENSYVGLFMQVGIIGLAAFAVLVGICVAPFLTRVARSPSVAPGAAGAVAAGLLLGLSQSYFHAAGNIAFIPFWTVLLLASTAGLGSNVSGA
jgi:hypothetical protein